MADHRPTAADHAPARIRARLAAQRNHDYLSDAILGGIDGCVTTFAVVAGATGGSLSALVVVVLGFANLIADGFSMAVGNYHATRSQRELVEQTRRSEERHIDRVPEGEREEIRQIFAQKGFEGDTLEQVVDTITANRQLWVDTMITEEHGLQLEGPDPVRAGAVTFVAFFLVGLVPLLPYIVPGVPADTSFASSAVLTAAAFFAIGWAKGGRLEQPRLRAAWETLWTGGAAALLAYGAGWLLRTLFGAG
ncbi:MAG: VIT1/CCC1 transporter family protein [Halofilum sp. (in: g-proteobacteria)]|nr:VIT1/CCC1 transporter family protein [Halofilum sp. (in: g-proteobacteria)]